jgi:hypothetical protein
MSAKRHISDAIVIRPESKAGSPNAARTIVLQDRHLLVYILRFLEWDVPLLVKIPTLSKTFRTVLYNPTLYTRLDFSDSNTENSSTDNAILLCLKRAGPELRMFRSANNASENATARLCAYFLDSTNMFPHLSNLTINCHTLLGPLITTHCLLGLLQRCPLLDNLILGPKLTAAADWRIRSSLFEIRPNLRFDGRELKTCRCSVPDECVATTVFCRRCAEKKEPNPYSCEGYMCCVCLDTSCYECTSDYRCCSRCDWIVCPACWDDADFFDECCSSPCEQIICHHCQDTCARCEDVFCPTCCEEGNHECDGFELDDVP